MRTPATLVLASSLSLLVACQGRFEPDYSLLEADGTLDDDVDTIDEQETRACEDAARCLDARRGQRDVAAAATHHKAPDDIRDGVLGGDVGVGVGTLGPSAMLEATCDGDIYTQVEQEQPGVELHVLSINHAGDDGVARVFVDREEAIALVLSSFEATHWIVDSVPGARITEIVLNGNGDQSVAAADHIAVTKLMGTQSLGAYGVGGADDKARQATTQLIQGAEEATGLSLRSFGGCHSGTAFGIGGQ